MLGMKISCCLSLFFFVFGTQLEPGFWWNIGLSVAEFKGLHCCDTSMDY